MKYLVPEKLASYKPDFVLPDQNLYVETKGQFRPEDRKKMLLVKEQYPDKQFLMVFGKPFNKISPRSRTTYAQWCDDHGLKWVSIDDVMNMIQGEAL